MQSSTPATIDLDQINEPPHQLRATIDPAHLRELADDLARRGLLQRIRVHPVVGDGRYTICAGHRRFLAARLLGWTEIPAEVSPACGDCTDNALAENIQRYDLTPVEEATALRALAASGRDAAALAHVVRKSEAWVHARLALLDYPPDLLNAIHAHKLPLSVAALLAEIDHPGYRGHLLQDALDHGATARTVSVWVQHYMAERPRIIANEETVEAIAARRHEYVILTPCDYCGAQDNLERTRVWRLCASCHDQLAAAVRGATGG